jgi:hypothetical protein
VGQRRVRHSNPEFANVAITRPPCSQQTTSCMHLSRQTSPEIQQVPRLRSSEHMARTELLPFREALRSAAVPAAVRRASRPPRRGQDALGTAGKMPALHKPGIATAATLRVHARLAPKTKSRAMKARDRERTSNRSLACLAFQHLNRFVQLFVLLWRLFLVLVSGSGGFLIVW